MWTKISSLEITIFDLKNDGKKWFRIYFEFDRAPSELLLPSAERSNQKVIFHYKQLFFKKMPSVTWSQKD